MSRARTPQSANSSSARTQYARRKPHKEAFLRLAKLQITAIEVVEAMLPAMQPADIITLIKTCTEAITTHRAVVTDDDEPEVTSALDDRLDTEAAGQREA